MRKPKSPDLFHKHFWHKSETEMPQASSRATALLWALIGAELDKKGSNGLNRGHMMGIMFTCGLCRLWQPPLNKGSFFLFLASVRAAIWVVGGCSDSLQVMRIFPAEETIPKELFLSDSTAIHIHPSVQSCSQTCTEAHRKTPLDFGSGLHFL